MKKVLLLAGILLISLVGLVAAYHDDLNVIVLENDGAGVSDDGNTVVNGNGGGQQVGNNGNGLVINDNKSNKGDKEKPRFGSVPGVPQVAVSPDQGIRIFGGGECEILVDGDLCLDFVILRECLRKQALKSCPGGIEEVFCEDEPNAITSDGQSCFDITNGGQSNYSDCTDEAGNYHEDVYPIGFFRCKRSKKPIPGDLDSLIINEEGFEMGDNSVKTKLKIIQRKGDKEKLKVIIGGKDTRTIILPDTASDRAKERLGELGFTIELKDVGKEGSPELVYELEGEKQGRFLGIFKVKAKVFALVDAETGEVKKVKKPWWGFLAGI